MAKGPRSETFFEATDDVKIFSQDYVRTYTVKLLIWFIWLSRVPHTSNTVTVSRHYSHVDHELTHALIRSVAYTSVF
jgi:hypothetical protein